MLPVLGTHRITCNQGLRRGSMALPSMPLDCDNDTTSLIHRRTSIMGCETFGDLSSLVEHALPELTETHGDEAEEDSDGSSASSNESWLSLEKSEKVAVKGHSKSTSLCHALSLYIYMYVCMYSMYIVCICYNVYIYI